MVEAAHSLLLTSAHNEQLLSERIAELELAIEDVGWQRVLGGGEDFEFSSGALKRILHLSRLYALKNPAIKRPVVLQAVYVWGQGVSIHATETKLDEVVQAFLADPGNQRSFTSIDALMAAERRLRVEGNLFLRLFTAPSGRVQVRLIPTEQIIDGEIITSPEDASEPWFYVRRWQENGKERTAVYPDRDYARLLEAERASTSGASELLRDAEVSGHQIDWETPVIHVKTGGYAEMRFGVPETYAALDWARAYKELLEDFKKIVKSLAKWAWDLKSGSDQASVNAAKAVLESTLGMSYSAEETNPAPAAGSTFIRRDGVELKAIDVSRAFVDPETFNRVLLQICAAMDTPSNFFGDAASGNLASAKTLDRPTELTFRARQQMWAGVIRRVLEFAIEAAATSAANADVKSDGYDEASGLMKLKVGGKQVELDINVDFPPILQKDAQAEVQALMTGITANGQSLQIMNDGPTILRLFLEDLGVSDIDETIELFYPKDGSASKARPIETFVAPKTPAQENSEPEPLPSGAMAGLPPSATARAPLGNQPDAQGPAGSANAGPKNKGGPNSRTAPTRAQEAAEAESEARIEFMNALIALGEKLGDDEA
jgi:hypothetical protein